MSDRTPSEVLHTMRKVEVEPAREVLRQCGHDDLVEALGVPDLFHGHERIGVADNATRRDSGAMKAGECGPQATPG
jgi:hypothetical protein